MADFYSGAVFWFWLTLFSIAVVIFFERRNPSTTMTWLLLLILLLWWGSSCISYLEKICARRTARRYRR